jgi:hypothetical protein
LNVWQIRVWLVTHTRITHVDHIHAMSIAIYAVAYAGPAQQKTIS